MYHSGFVSIIGKPNVGKSTFLNAVIGEKVAITSSKPQTTRYRLEGIYHSEKGQIVFVDTPGIHQAKHVLAEKMVKEAYSSLKDMDVVLYMISAVSPFDEEDQMILSALKKLHVPVIMVVNKLDIVKDFKRLETHIEKFKSAMDFELVVAISAKTKKHLNELIEDILLRLKEGPAFYPSNMSTNRSKKFLMAELIREKILHLTHQEVPHSVFVNIETITRDDDNLLVVHANIMVERATQKKIIIGKNGELIKRIGTRARLELKPLLNEKLFLDLHVKVSKDWRKKNHIVDTLYSGDFE